MVKKKNPKFELESSRKVFFQLGLFIVGSATLMAFSYKTPVYLNKKKELVEREIDIPIMLVEKDIEPIVEIPVVEKLPSQTEPSTPIVFTDLLNKATPTKNTKKNPQLVVTSGEPAIDPSSFNVGFGAAPAAPLVDYPDFEPEFPGSWLGYLEKAVIYPEESIFFNESGSAYVSFVVEIDGSVTDVQIKNKTLSKALQKEAIRVVKASPKWKPGSMNGEFVRSTKIVKINFLLE